MVTAGEFVLGMDGGRCSDMIGTGGETAVQKILKA